MSENTVRNREMTDSSVASCTEMVRRGDPDRFYSAMTASPELRDDLMVLYGFNLEVARAPWVTSEEMIAEMRLQWWVDAIDEIYGGGGVRKHEVVSPLAHIVERHELPRGLFDGLIAARRFDIYKEPHSDRAGFDAYIKGTAGNLMELAGLVLGAGDDVLPIVRDFAFAIGISNFFRALPVLVQSGRMPVPGAWVQDRAAIARGELLPPLETELLALAREARSRIAVARSQKRDVARRLHPALLAGYQADRVLKYAIRRPLTILEGSLETSEFAQRGTLLVKSVSGRW